MLASDTEIKNAKERQTKSQQHAWFRHRNNEHQRKPNEIEAACLFCLSLFNHWYIKITGLKSGKTVMILFELCLYIF